MKYFILFMLFFPTNCFKPTAILATVNARNATVHSVFLSTKKLSFKERIISKYAKSVLTKKANNHLTVAIILLILGVLMLTVPLSLGFGGSTLAILIGILSLIVSGGFFMAVLSTLI